MKPGLRFKENATCRISICNALPIHMRQQTRELSRLDVPENLRRQGMAWRLLTGVTEEADKHNVTLVLFVKPFGTGLGMSAEMLEEWYQARFGFHTIQKNPTMMARMPHSTPQRLNYIASAVKETK
jgi:N-acetylglutamate synthase-like GNAT family acetyltransferase